MNQLSQPSLRSRAPLVFFVLLWVVLIQGEAMAQVAPPPLPTQSELTAAQGLLKRGQVTVVPPSGAKGKASVILLTRVSAPAKTAYKVVAEPGRYPDFMKALQKVTITSRHKNTQTYNYQWHAGGMPWKGSCSMALAPSTDVAVRVMKSDFGIGQMRWHFYPQTASTSLMAHAATFDMNSGNQVLRWLLGRGAAMPEALALTLSTVLLEGSRSRAEVLAKAKTNTVANAPASALTAAELIALGPLFKRGTVILVERSANGAFRNALVAQTVDAPVAVVTKLLAAPDQWPSAVPVVSELEVTSRKNGAPHDVRIEMNLSIFSVDGAARITKTFKGVTLQGTGGSFSKTRMQFTATPLPDGRTVLQSVGRADMTHASFLLRRLVQREPTFAHGLNSAAQLLFVRGLAHEAERRAKNR